MYSDFEVKELLADNTCNADDIICIADSANANVNRGLPVRDLVQSFRKIVTDATGAVTAGATHWGKVIAATKSDGATTITLPAPSTDLVGAWFEVIQTVDQNLTIIGATANNNAIIADGVLTTDSVVFSTSSHKIGARAFVMCVSATKWFIANASSCTMTVEAAD